MADWYSSIQSVYNGRLILLNIVCELWQLDTAQYSLCIMPIDTFQYSLCIMKHWYTTVQSVYHGTLIHHKTFCVIRHTVTPPSTHEHFTFFGTVCCSHCKRFLNFGWQNYPCKWHFLIRLYILPVSTYIVVTLHDPVCDGTNMMSQYHLRLSYLTISYLTVPSLTISPHTLLSHSTISHIIATHCLVSQ